MSVLLVQISKAICGCILDLGRTLRCCLNVVDTVISQHVMPMSFCNIMLFDCCHCCSDPLIHLCCYNCWLPTIFRCSENARARRCGIYFTSQYSTWLHSNELKSRWCWWDTLENIASYCSSNCTIEEGSTYSFIRSGIELLIWIRYRLCKHYVLRPSFSMNCLFIVFRM